MKINKLFFFIICLFYGLYINNIYRVELLSNNSKKGFLFDVGSNIVFIPILYSLLSYFLKKQFNSPLKDITNIFIFLSILEVLSYFFPFFGTFDIKDIIGLFLGSIITIIVYIHEPKNKND